MPASRPCGGRSSSNGLDPSEISPTPSNFSEWRRFLAALHRGTYGEETALRARSAPSATLSLSSILLVSIESASRRSQASPPCCFDGGARFHRGHTWCSSSFQHDERCVTKVAHSMSDGLRRHQRNGLWSLLKPVPLRVRKMRSSNATRAAKRSGVE
jgi:hypothetical protein